MVFRYYFFKEQDRNYDLADLIAFFQAVPNISLEKVGSERRMNYVNEMLDFKATFVISDKSILKSANLVSIDPKYLDLNIYVEFNLLLANYKIELVVDIIENLCKRFKFCVYNEVFEDVLPFRRMLLLKAFEKVKEAYKSKYEDEIAEYNKLEPMVLNSVYKYLENKSSLKNIFKEDKIVPLDYIFYKKLGSRRAYVGVKWDGYTPFIIPSNVDLLVIYENGNNRFIHYKEFEAKIIKVLKPVESDLFGLCYITYKDMKKVRKELVKGKFSAINQNVELIQIDLKQILDI